MNGLDRFDLDVCTCELCGGSVTRVPSTAGEYCDAEQATEVVTMLTARADALTAENERLRAERKERDDMWRRRQDNWRASSDRCLAAAEAHLATAEGLLREWRARFGNSVLNGPTDAFLASAQPAAPTFSACGKTESGNGRGDVCGLSAGHGGPCEFDWPPAAQPAAPARCGYGRYPADLGPALGLPSAPARECADHWGADCQNCDLAERSNTSPARTEAERAVLDAMALVPASWLRWLAKSAGCWNVIEFKAVGEAELARRGSR